MSYSRSRTLEKKRSRRGSRVRFLVALNLVLFVLVAAAVIWFVKAAGFGGTPHSAQVPTSPAESSAPSGPSNSPDPSSSAGPDNSGASGSEPPHDGSGKIKLAFVGDILPAANVAQLMEKFGYDYPFREARGLLQSADIAAGNLETPITNRGTPEQNKQYLFHGPVEALPAIRDAGFDVLSLANNHSLDYGWVGLQDTMDALDDHGLHHMGSGIDDKQAFTPVYIKSKGMTVAYIGVTKVVPNVSWKADSHNPGVAEAYSPARAEAAIKDAKSNADVVVVMVHWGIERADKPKEDIKNLGRRFIDAGADLVIGSHPHVLQGFEIYNNKWIAYSLGNFVFNATATPKTSETGVLMAECGKDGDCSLEFHPMLAKHSQPAPMDESAGKALLARLSAVSATATVEENGNLVAKR